MSVTYTGGGPDGDLQGASSSAAALVEAVSLSYGAAPLTSARALSALSEAALASGHLNAAALCLHLATGASLVTQVGQLGRHLWAGSRSTNQICRLILDPPI